MGFELCCNSKQQETNQTDKRPGKVNCFVGRSSLQEANTLADDVKITNKPPTHKRFSLQSKLSPLQTFLGERQGSRLSLQPTLISTVPFDFSSIPCTLSIYRLEHTNARAGTQYTKQLFKLMQMEATFTHNCECQFPPKPLRKNPCCPH